MKKFAAVLVTSLCLFGPAFASDSTDVMATVHRFMDGLNKDDVKSALAACADQTSITDDFAPHEWSGAGACATWLKDFGDYMTKQGIVSGPVVLHRPRHVEVTADRAYVVVPADYRFTEHGKKIHEVGSVFTVVLHKMADGWRISSWTWSKG